MFCLIEVGTRGAKRLTHFLLGRSTAVLLTPRSLSQVTSYVHASAELLGCQIDAPINSGASGGAAVNASGECVGIAFQSMAGSGDAENIGYIIPGPVVHHFLSDYDRNGRKKGKEREETGDEDT